MYNISLVRHTGKESQAKNGSQSLYNTIHCNNTNHCDVTFLLVLQHLENERSEKYSIVFFSLRSKSSEEGNYSILFLCLSINNHYDSKVRSKSVVSEYDNKILCYRLRYSTCTKSVIRQTHVLVF